MATENIPSRLHSVAEGNVVTGANEILDDGKNKKQNVINQENDQRLETLETAVGTGGSVDSRIESAKTEIVGGASSDCNTLGKAEALISTNANDIAALQEAYAALTQNDVVVVAPSDTWPVATPEQNTIYRVVDRTNTPPQYYTDYMWNGSAMVEMAQYNNAIDAVPTAGSHNLVESGGVYKQVLGKLVSFINTGPILPLSEPLNSGDIIVEIGGAEGVLLYKNNSDMNYLRVMYEDLPITLSDTYTYAASNTGNGTIQTNRVVYADDIADNLTTDDKLKVLSARQGKLLNDTYINNIDNEPTLSSTKLVRSGGVAKQLSVYQVKVEPDYSNDVEELYIVDLPNGNVILKSFDNDAYCYSPGTGVYCASDHNIVTANNIIYPIKVYNTNDSVNYPVGKIVAYVIFNNYQHFISNPTGQENNIVNRSRCEILTNSPIIADYLTYNDKINSLDREVFKQPYFDENTSTFPSAGITSSALMKSFIKDFKMLIQREDEYDYGITKINNGLPAGEWYAYAIQVGKWPHGETPTISNFISLGSYFTADSPKSGYINIDNVAEVIVDWSVLTTPFGSGAYFDGVGTGIKYIQENIFSKEIPYRLDTLEAQSKDLSERTSELENVVEHIGNNVVICIPDIIYAVVGDTLQLYYKSILRCVNYQNYDINFICDIGHQYPRYYEVTPLPSNIGDHSISIKIKDNNNNILNEKNVMLKVVNVTNSPLSQLNVLAVGASATQDGQWASEFKRRLIGTGGTPTGRQLTNITFVGRKSVTYDGKHVNLEATGGYQFGSYTSTSERLHKFFFTEQKPAGSLNVGDVYSFTGHNYTIKEINLSDGVGNISCIGDTDVTGSGTLTKVSGTGSASMEFASSRSDGNPFVYNGVIDIQQYADDYCNGQIDVIYTELFGNALNAYSDIFPTALNNMRTFINQFKTVFPNIKFCIGIPWCPDVRGGMGVNYGAAGGWSLVYGMKYSFMNLCNQLQKYITDNNLGDYVYICNWLNEFDEENDFRQTTKPVNTRSEVTEIFGVNGVHPSIVGYNQMADSAYRLFVSKFCQ